MASKGWKPIASAPRDGTAWTQHPAEHGDDFRWCYHITRGGAFTVMARPTHWQSLPPLPKD